MAADDDDLLASVARHLGGGLLQQFQLQARAVGNGARLVLGFVDLAEVIFRKNDRVFLLRGLESRVTNVDQVRTHWAGRAVLFDDSER